MSNQIVLNRAYNTLEGYVKRVTRGATFTTNDIRERLEAVPGLRPSQIGSVVNKALNRGLIATLGFTRSNNPNHKGGLVGTYFRPFSY